MKILVLGILILTLLSFLNASIIPIPTDVLEDNEFATGEKFRRNDFDDDECRQSVLLTPTKKSIELEIEKEHRDKMSEGLNCYWSIFGTENCVPVLDCSGFEIEPGTADGTCEHEFLEVTDGSKGYEKFCGKTGPQSKTPTQLFRDIYITLKTSSSSAIKKRDFKCKVTCSPGGAEGTPLKVNNEPDINEHCNCGRKPNANRIVGGTDAKSGEFPWIAALVTSGTRKPFCGGTVINSRFVLTAAHCFKGPYVKSKNLQILLNAHNLDLTDSSVAKGGGDKSAKMTNEDLKAVDAQHNSYRYSVDRYFLHPLYIRQTNDFDVALIKLDRPIDFATMKEVSPACLPGMASYGESKEGVKAVVAGWGLNASDSTATMSVLQKLEVNVFQNAECKTFFDQRFTRRMMCAGHLEAGKDSCKGDSGGPLISEKKKQVWELIGVVSWGDECGKANSPGVYANTRENEQWIRFVSNMEDASWCVD